MPDDYVTARIGLAKSDPDGRLKREFDQNLFGAICLASLVLDSSWTLSVTGDTAAPPNSCDSESLRV